MLHTHFQEVKTSIRDFRQLKRNHHNLHIRVPVILMLAAARGFLVIPAMAHAPSNFTIGYNPDMHKLSITITHPVDNPKTHYIRGVQVTINGKVISDPTYENQAAKNTFTYTYDVMADPGDVYGSSRPA